MSLTKLPCKIIFGTCNVQDTINKHILQVVICLTLQDMIYDIQFSWWNFYEIIFKLLFPRCNLQSYNASYDLHKVICKIQLADSICRVQLAQCNKHHRSCKIQFFGSILQNVSYNLQNAGNNFKDIIYLLQYWRFIFKSETDFYVWCGAWRHADRQGWRCPQ